MAQRLKLGSTANKVNQKRFELGTPNTTDNTDTLTISLSPRIPNNNKQASPSYKSSPFSKTNSLSKKKGSGLHRISITGTPNTPHDYKVGDKVRLNDLREGHIRYVGQTSFSKHILYGIELDDKYDGKHSGMVKGVKYFDCMI